MFYSLKGPVAAAAVDVALEGAARSKAAEVALEALLKPQGLYSRLLTDVMWWHLAKPNCDCGVVLDGLDSRFVVAKLEGGVVGSKDGRVIGNTEAAGVARAVTTAMPEARLLVLRFRDEKNGCDGEDWINAACCSSSTFSSAEHYRRIYACLLYTSDAADE